MHAVSTWKLVIVVTSEVAEQVTTLKQK